MVPAAGDRAVVPGRVSDILGAVTEPLPPLITITTDIARQSALDRVLAAVTDLSGKVDVLMTQDAIVAAAVSRIEADQQAVLTAVNSLQALIETLQAEVAAGTLTPATMDALAKATADMDALKATAEADVAKDIPPSAAPG